MIEKLAHLTPQVHASCFVHPLASVIGQVTLGENVSVFPCAVLRGDIAAICVGKNSNIQDNAVLHVNYGCPCEIGVNVSVGHGAVVHGSKIADNVVIGMNATVMESEIGPNCVIGAGAVVPAGKQIPAGSLVMGVPGKVVRALTEAEIRAIAENATAYVQAIPIYKNQAKTL